jgi:hypothetical protein
MDGEDLVRLDNASDQPVGKRLARIETRVFKLMEGMNINPRTGRRYERRDIGPT